MASESAEKKSFSVKDVFTYFVDAKNELKKVSRPTRQETIQATLATLVIIIFVSVCLFVLDLVFGRLMTAILS